MNSFLVKRLCFIILYFSFSTNFSTTCAGIMYSAFGDFSATSNPTLDGIWSYGYTSTLGSSLNLYTSTSLHGHYSSNLSQWTDNVRIDPNVIKNETGVDIMLPLSGYFIIPATEYLYFHPGPQGEYSVIRWIAPSTGIFEIDSEFRAPINTCPTSADVHVLYNGYSLYDALVEQEDCVSDKDPRIFTTSLLLTAGEVVDFCVGYGTNNDYICDRMLMSASITQLTTSVFIDIKPDSFPNRINPRSRGVIPVAILSTAIFSATNVEPASVDFGRSGIEAEPVHFTQEDVNADGRMDMLFHFRTQATGIQCGDNLMYLSGITYDGHSITGNDFIQTVGCE